MYDFKKREEEILNFWEKENVFEKSSELRRGSKKFVFFEGPPTANGRPGIHHFLGRAFKDIFNRYKTMRGFFVVRKAGWDTHGLPVEIEVEKSLGFKTKKDIENYGIANFNKKAKESVWKYKTEWEEMTRRMGFWVDLKNPYVTYDNNYIETLWYIIQQIWKKNLLYLAHKVVPFCFRCGTPLSSHEVAQGYKSVIEKSVYIKFRISDPHFSNKLGISKNSKVYILAWTTTPWTLPGNLALAVGKDIKYQVVSVKGKDEKYILAEELVGKVLNGEYTVHNTIPGAELMDLEYEPLFKIGSLESDKSYKVYEADFVSTEDGTGVVHTAVMYGEDDYELGTKIGLPKVHTVTEAGVFNGVSKELDGKYVKDPLVEKNIIDYLNENNLLLKTEDYEHDYPFCWRCDSPLLYYAKSSWFIKMSALKDQLLKNNSKINWIPEHIKDGRFGQWIKEGKDWAFSRERYWGTPLPAWKCQKCNHHKVVGSIAEMEKSISEFSSKNNTYYTLRHGYTTRDERGKMIISFDPQKDTYQLTSEGRQQIEKVAELIKHNHHIDFIFCSPMLRTTETAEIVAKSLHIKVHKDERIGEIVEGNCDGKSYTECQPHNRRKHIDDRLHEMGETWNDVRKRVYSFVLEMESRYKGKNILIVSHGDPIWLLETMTKGASGKEIVEDSRSGVFHYPKIAEFRKIEWRNIPRNEYGELDLHRPFIDSVSLKCDECGALMKKIPDLIDVWFDSGAMPYAQWHWPFENKKIFEEQFPAEFIAEGIDQTRGWFYTLLAISTLLGKGNSYKNVMSLGHVLDEKGKKMSKSKGNVVSPFEVMDRVGVDAARWYFYTLNSPGEYKLFAMKDVESKLKGFIFTLQNCVRFFELYNQETDKEKNPHGAGPKALHSLDKWILSKLNGLIVEISSDLDQYDVTTASRLIEKFVVDDLSNWWLRRSRKRKDSLALLRLILLELSRLMAPFIPFVAEDIYLRLRTTDDKNPESVHLNDWPKINKKLINKKLEQEMEEARLVVTSGLAERKEKQIKVRQPLRSATVIIKSKFSKDIEELIKDELNVKSLLYGKSSAKDKENIDKIVILDTVLGSSLIREGYARELIRQLQDMRKEAKYKIDEKILCWWHSDSEEIKKAIADWDDSIKKEALLKDFRFNPNDKITPDVSKDFELSPQQNIWIGIKK